MGLFVNTNMSSLLGQNVVDRNNKNLTSTMQKLSTGLRINSSKDDAAGMAVAEALTTQIRGNDMARRNGNDAISMAQTAETALTQIINNVQRIREVSVQATSDALSIDDQDKLQTEVDQLTQEISRIVDTTEFNGTYLLSDPVGTRDASATFQVGHSGTATNQITFAYSDLTTTLISLGGGTKNFYNADLTGTQSVFLITTGESSASIQASDQALDVLINERARYGAIQTRFETAMNNLAVYNENLTASRSRIQDADFATETANLTRHQILQQAGTAMLSQANAVPQSVLSLLR